MNGLQGTRVARVGLTFETRFTVRETVAGVQCNPQTFLELLASLVPGPARTAGRYIYK
jgi:hypothetical protein